MVEVKCRGCGKIFSVHNCRKDKAKYCSVKCRCNRVTKVCETCGDSFSVARVEKERLVCCSVSCSAKRKRRKRQIEIEEEFGKPISELLHSMYHEQKQGIKKIAKLIGVSDRNLWDWFDDLGIERRARSDAVSLQWHDNDERRKKNSELLSKLIEDGIIDIRGDNNPAKQQQARKKISESKLGPKNWMHGRGGEQHHAWRGGKVYYYGPSWFRQRNLARKRDGYACRVCGISEKEFGRQLDVHHIKKFRNFGIENHEEGNALENLMCLCHSCHVLMESVAE